MQNVISRIKATHFIEIYKGMYSKEIYQQSCYEIIFLDFSLKCTEKTANLKTIGIFKIKLK